MIVLTLWDFEAAALTLFAPFSTRRRMTVPISLEFIFTISAFNESVCRIYYDTRRSSFVTHDFVLTSLPLQNSILCRLDWQS